MRFEEIDGRMMKFISSLELDKNLFREDIDGSIVYAEALSRIGIFTEEELSKVKRALLEIKEGIERGEIELKEELEDIHMNIEFLLKERVGDLALKLHTGRSRNDQIALDMRLFLKRKIPEVIDGIKEVGRAILELAERNKDAVMPGYTHLQRAQPVLFSHHLLAYFEMLRRDIERLRDALKRVDIMPLGSSALAGTPFPIDREYIKERLGFSELSRNSIDAVSSRDFILEFLFSLSTFFLNISRFMEELILWSSSEFGFIELDDSFVGFSSIMPQKRNPDGAELIRAKSSKVFSDLFHLLCVMKSLPLSYNRDLQEDKVSLFDAIKIFEDVINFLPDMIRGIRVNKERMREACDFSLLATDLADYLVRKGIPFREAHGIVSRLMRGMKGKPKLEDLKKLSDKFEEDALKIDERVSVEMRDVYGGTSTRRVEEAIKEGWRFINEG